MLQRQALEASPLADLHELAGEIGLEGFRRLRKADLIDRLLEVSAGNGSSDASTTDAPAAKASSEPKNGSAPKNGSEPKSSRDAAPSDDDTRSRRSRGRSRRNSRDDDANDTTSSDERRPDERRPDERRPDERPTEDRQVEGVVEILAGGTGFIRVNHPEQSDDDVYVSAAQVRRCELVSGDRIAGPVRSPRRSERFPSLIRVETIDGKPAEEVAGEGVRFTDTAATYPVQRFELGAGDDVTLKAIEWLAPIGRGSRVVVHGPAHAGKTEVLRKLATALANVDDLALHVVLAGARPEELTAWAEADPAPDLTTAPLGATLDQQTAAIERAIDQARRIAQRGGDAVVIIDAISELAPHIARRVLASARNLVDGGSLTIIASAYTPIGGETTLIALDPAAAGGARFDLQRSSTLRPDLLVGPEGAAAIAEARAARS